LDFLKLKPLCCTKTTSLVLQWAKIRCAESSPVILTFVSTMCVNSYWMASSNSCLCARTKWWLIPSPEACRPRLSSGTARSWLVMLLLPLDSYVASAANFERWLWALRFSWFFPLDCLYFCLAFYVTSRFSAAFYYFFPASLFIIFNSCFRNSSSFWFAQYCLSEIPLLNMGESDKAPTNKICHHASSEQRPRTRSCHESERLGYALSRSTTRDHSS